MDDRAVDHHVVVEELGGPGGVGHDPADGAGDEEHILGPVGLEPVVHRGLIAQVELSRLAVRMLVNRRPQPPDHRRTDKARWPATKIRAWFSKGPPLKSLAPLTP